MSKKINKLDGIVLQIIELEKNCQAGQNIKENMSKMDSLIKDLSIGDMLYVSMELEKHQFGSN